jgi:NAD(P)-dependent dehydrogenase (short-subunit alcohol dehydrogenase family)
MKALEGRTAWVTGGASGIGYATVRKLRALGAQVAILDVARPVGFPDEEEVTLCDISSRASVEEAAKALEDRFGGPDILVNSAGISGGAPIAEFPDDLWNRILAVNLTGSFNMIRRVIGGMMERRWGRIVLVSSDAAFQAGPGQAAYASTKAAVVVLGQITAVEGGPAGVTCNVLSPGIIDTPMAQRRWSSREELEAAVNAQGTRNPLGAVLEADDLAHAAAFLCHPDSGHITGQTLHINGGMVMR